MTTLDRQPQDKFIANNSQRMVLSANKNWRANYLRALNIVTPDLSTSTLEWRVLNGEGTRRTASQERINGRGETTTSRRTATVTDEVTRRFTSNNSRRGRSAVSTLTSARQSSSRSGSSSRSKRVASPSDDRLSTYVFGLRSHLLRARRHAPKSDLVMADRVSAPIEIPTGTSVTSPTAIPSRAEKLLDQEMESRRRRGCSNDFQNLTDLKQPMVQLLSWEEPSVMLGNSGWPLESEKRNSSSIGNNMSAGFVIPIYSRKSRRSSRPGGIDEVCEDTEDEDVDRLTNSENDDDDIFKMEFDGDPKAGSNIFRGKQASNHWRRADLRQRRPCGFDEFDEEDDVVTSLSASFVPPHQMVKHGCFSLGLRGELKRRPGVH